MATSRTRHERHYTVSYFCDKCGMSRVDALNHKANVQCRPKYSKRLLKKPAHGYGTKKALEAKRNEERRIRECIKAS